MNAQPGARTSDAAVAFASTTPAGGRTPRVEEHGQRSALASRILHLGSVDPTAAESARALPASTSPSVPPDANPNGGCLIEYSTYVTRASGLQTKL
ncbi:hypothetical protein CONPUDRAFT_148780 [Coniophora puteana RWD-64-598 SS2]|uniref:Uncharacterized protein n=1 Tax=Coniophora puteana (strain RWD-64-598) TaxID=741705 RepID=A0A5M3N797_CONPW|nr:uncharacterized protein CONPUDRAFT_148780 [Coniophora puteana RWD-64-598 SS2]EIW86721.1 hypothetical protein CONPUDRAFT_148780 [Coniophora puteana RWD-64-598 SS2]